MIINISVLVVLTGITLLILFLSYRELDFAEIWATFKRSKGWSIVAAFGCMLLFILFEALALLIITRRLGHKTKFRAALAYSASDTYYSAITPSASGGQPASMYYMVRDGMSGGVAGFSLVLNLLAYTAAAIIMGLFAFIVRPGMFGLVDGWAAQTLIIVGFVIQVVVLGFFFMCIMWSKAILKLGNGAISLLKKIHIIKHVDKWREKWKGGVDKYSASRHIIREHPMLFFWALLLNLAQRVAQNLIPCFVCYAMSDAASFLDIFVMQTFVLLGYNMIPLPGGVGAYEFVYLNTYSIYYPDSFILSVMMISRLISYYACIVVSGIYTFVYHSVGLKSKRKPETDKLGDWQYSMYSEGEEWCVGEQTPMYYTEGETSDDALPNTESSVNPDGADNADNADNTDSADSADNAEKTQDAQGGETEDNCADSGGQCNNGDGTGEHDATTADAKGEQSEVRE